MLRFGRGTFEKFATTTTSSPAPPFYHRWENGGAGDDVVVVANFSNVPLPNLSIGFPRGGQWHVRFNSGAKVYDPSFENGDSFDTAANPGGVDGLNFNANVGVGPYS